MKSWNRVKEKLVSFALLWQSLWCKLVDTILENVDGLCMNFPIPDTLENLVMQVQTTESPVK